MAEAKTYSIIPSGQIYRQMFDAEVQLVNAYDKVKKSKADRKLEKVSGQDVQDRIPLVKESRRSMGESMLADRHIKWIEALPNDSKTQNPTLYRQNVAAQTKARRENDSILAAREVRGLAETVRPEIGSDIIERIAEKRRKEHESTVEDMHHQLSIISAELEPKIVEYGQMLLEKLAENDLIIQEILERITSDEVLISYTVDDLDKLWEEVAFQSLVRQHWITELDETLDQIEKARQNRIGELMMMYAKKLEKIAYQLAPDVHRLIEKESQVINQILLGNRRSCADLFSRLMKVDIEREKNQHEIWEGRVQDWKSLKTDIAINKFLNYMQSDFITKPKSIERIIAELQTEQKKLHQRRLQMLDALREMKPPASTKTAVYHWYSQLTAVMQQINSLHVRYVDKLHAEYERICQNSLDQLEKHREELQQAGICTEEMATAVIEEHFLPRIGERQKAYEDILEEISKSLEQEYEEQESELKLLFKFSQGASHVWDVHEIGLAKQERLLQEKLEALRRNHDNKNQDLEANLDVTMDRMRQESSEQALKEVLQKSQNILDKIKQGYESFYKEQMSVVKAYPLMVREELKKYDAGICTFFGIDRTHPEEKTELPQEDELLQSDQFSVSDLETGKIEKVKKRPSEGARGDLETPQSLGMRQSSMSERLEEAAPEPAVTLAVKEVLTTNRGTTFYVLAEVGEQLNQEEESQPKPEQQQTDEEKAETGRYSAFFKLEPSLLMELRHILRNAFLDHMEEWTEQATERANSVVAAKCEELNSELELRLHLHGPRSQRAQLDIHNVRAAELVMHQDRVSRHAKGISTALTDLKTRFSDMQYEHNKLADQFKEDIDKLESDFASATRSSALVSLQNRVSSMLDSYMAVIRASLRQFRKSLDDTLQMLRESNARFRKSFKVFSDGGNFSPEEIDEYRKRLEKLSSKIDSSEGHVMADLEGMEAKRLQQATDIASKFEDRFKNHLFDLTFIERMARWLTNTQVKIKSEVAESNTQALGLTKHLQAIKRRIDAVERPNLDKEQITSEELLESLHAVFEAANKRSKYLDCLKLPEPLYMGEPLQGNIALSGKVVAEDLASEQAAPPQADQPPAQPALQKGGKGGKKKNQQAPPATTTSSKPNKGIIDDAAVGIIKNIMRTQRVGGEEEFEMISSPAKAVAQQLALEDLPKSKGVSRPQTQAIKAGQEKDMRLLKPLSRRSTAISLDGSSNPRRSASIARRKSSSTKFDKKYYVFGEKLEFETHLLALIRRILQESMDGLLSTAEIYYKQKGTRNPTRPHAIQPDFDSCADIVVSKLQSYYSQAEDFHNQSIQEFRKQLEGLELLSSHVPALVIKDLFVGEMKNFHNTRDQLDREFKLKLQVWDNMRMDHQNLLRPALGHPHNKTELDGLCTKEESRNKEYVQSIEEHTATLKEEAKDMAKLFVERLATKAEKMLLMYDNELTIDEIVTGSVDAVKHKASTLIKRQHHGVSLDDKEYKPVIERGTKVWDGLPLEEMAAAAAATAATEKQPEGQQTTASITSGKTTLAHAAIVDARDQAYQKYVKEFESNSISIGDQRQVQMTAEERWNYSWQTSVNKIKQLY